MAQKINPISFRLGLTQVWDSTIQNYGKLLTNYSIILHNRLQIYQFLVQFFNFNNFLLGLAQFSFLNNKALLNIFYSNPKHGFILGENIFMQLSRSISNYLFFDRILIRLYPGLRWFSTADLVFNYTQFLVKQNISLNKIFWNLCRFFETQLHSEKILYSTYGPIVGELKGFKICLSGRFDSSRNQMAKSINYKVGSLSLVNLQSYIEFVNSEINTKLGVCGIQIWLFYKIH